MTTQICPYCGKDEFIACKQPHGYASVTVAEKKIAFNGQTLYHDVCKHCGTVCRSYVKNPESLG